MNMRELIEMGNDKAGTQKALGDLLGVRTQTLAAVKAGKEGLPVYACYRLAEFIGADPAEVVAASELVTIKDEERRKVFYPFVMGKAAGILVASALIGLFVPTKPAMARNAIDTFEESSTSAEAAPVLKVTAKEFTLCQLLYKPA